MRPGATADDPLRGQLSWRVAQIGHAVCCARPSAVVLLGDLELERPLHEELADVAQLTDIWWIPGNHEFDDEASYANVFDSELKFRNLDCRVVEVAG